MEAGDEATVAHLEALQKELRVKKTFVSACQSLAGYCEGASPLSSRATEALREAGKCAFMVLQTRFTNPKFWQAGLEFFLAIEFHLPDIEDASRWREAAMEEVDEEARERALEQKRLRKFQEDKAHNQGLWGDAATPITMPELMAASGMVAVDYDDARPGMSRDARNELRLVTLKRADMCVVCQEPMPAGSKAKAMPCGHIFHDDCIMSWVSKHNSCPTCRFDEYPSEKIHFDDTQRKIAQSPAGDSGLYT
mmetsp:Transcript_128069/g.362522  ORF Transcript_128069/g.362522 Transcript_128069/m.362522 type:complete len:251 (+) Transcript_128069:99-851(+)